MFEANISSIDNFKDLSTITLAEILNILNAQEYRTLIGSEGYVEGALPTKSDSNKGDKGKKKWNMKETYVSFF